MALLPTSTTCRVPLFVRIIHPGIIECLPLIGDTATLTVISILFLLLGLVSTFDIVLFGAIIIVLALMVVIFFFSVLISLVLVFFVLTSSLALSLVLTLLQIIARLLVPLFTKPIAASGSTHRTQHAISQRRSGRIAVANISLAPNLHQLPQARSKDPFRLSQQAQTIVLPGLGKGRQCLHLVLEDGPQHTPLFGRGALDQ